MKFVRGIRTLALSALIFSGSCTSDATDPVDAVEEENRVPDQTEEIIDSEIPSPQAASDEAKKQGEETVDSNSSGDVQKLAAEQQLPADEAAKAVANGAGQEVATANQAISNANAEVESVEAPGLTPAPAGSSPALPEAPVAPIAVAEAPAASPALPAETEQVAPAETIPTIAEANDATPSEFNHTDSDKKVKASKAKKSGKAKHSHHASKGKKSPALSGNEKVYIVQPGDTLGSIAGTIYGSKREWKALANLNGIKAKGRIYPGDALKYTSNAATAAFEARFDGLAKASVTVEHGDTLSKIAARVMGQSSFWKLIWRWNEATLTNPNKIAVGQTLQYVSAKDLSSLSSGAPAAEEAH
ncbi:MAG: LysM peptidoglycan-binding domain-containing protein [Chitinophagaceae bacterium]|nr:LysM peptidoglycan-binding domain-containing protein [Oligoflexus sp.]